MGRTESNQELETPDPDLRTGAVPAADLILVQDDRQLERLKALLAALENEGSRAEAIACLHEVAARLSSGESGGLKLHRVVLPGCGEPINLLLNAAVFSPEFWGRTFAEGLLKGAEVFDGRSVVELGTGSGWISLLLLLRTRVRRVVGLDINPTAVLMANLNKWLNGTRADGTYVQSLYGEPIPGAMRAEVSDLLGQPVDQGQKFDFVIGCIPQVLHPDPQSVAGRRGLLSDQDLYDLSNYCFEQGILEDRFGLPLIARALEQAQLCLNAGGQVILILGGRPGPQAIESMFRRRGFAPELLWSRRIRQADDTDLASLVELENVHGIRFNFFMSMTSECPVPASTAVRLIGAGEPVYHDLLVYRASTVHERPTSGFVANMHRLGLTPLRKELDFSRISEEQISFMERLSADMLRSKSVPYPHERGDLSLRERIARFLRIYCHYPARAERLFVGPERHQLVRLVLSMLGAAGDRVLVSAGLKDVYGQTVSDLGLDLVLGNDDLSELVELDERLRPTVVLIAPVQFAQVSPITLKALCDHAAAHPDRFYLIDDSGNFDISSSLGSNTLLRLAALRGLPANVIFVYGLIKNVVCPDLELSFMVNSPDAWTEWLDVGAELTYSRISYPTQLYYEWLFDGMLSFPVADDLPASGPAPASACGEPVKSFQRAASDAVFAAKPVPLDTPGLIRMDYGEFEAPVPDSIFKGLIHGFLDEISGGWPDIVRQRVSSYLQVTRGQTVDPARVVLGQGVFPLLGNLIDLAARTIGRPPVVALPRGSYGPLYPLVVYHGGRIVEIETREEDGFMLSPRALFALGEKPDILWLTQPNNPSGLYFSARDVQALVRACAEREIFIIADEIFFLLSAQKMGAWTPRDLSFAYFLDAHERKWVFLSDGLSKSFAAGGLRCGFMVCPDETWARHLQARCPLPTRPALRAWDAVYSAFLDESPHSLIDVSREREAVSSYLLQARTLLSQQRDSLLDLLRSHGVDDGLDTHLRGGLFLLARLGEHVDRLARQARLLVNSPDWSRSGRFSRICFSLPPARFAEAMERLSSYLAGESAGRRLP